MQTENPGRGGSGRGVKAGGALSAPHRPRKEKAPGLLLAGHQGLLLRRLESPQVQAQAGLPSGWRGPGLPLAAGLGAPSLARNKSPGSPSAWDPSSTAISRTY